MDLTRAQPGAVVCGAEPTRSQRRSAAPHLLRFARPMKIVFLTPGTGSYYCGVCMRDNAIAREMIRQGHEALLVPMYLPLTLDEQPVSADLPVFYGGISVYMKQKFALFRHTPRWLDTLLNARGLLRLAGRQSSMTDQS